MNYKIPGCFFLAVIFLCFIGLVPQFIYNHATALEVERDIRIDWKEEYPFCEEPSKGPAAADDTGQNGPRISEKAGRVLGRYKTFVDKAETKITSVLNNNFPLRIKLIEANGKVLKASGIKKITGSVIDLGDGSLSLVYGKRDVSRYAEEVNDFNEWIGGKGIGFIHVVAPMKIGNDKRELSGYTDYSNENQDLYISLLDDGVDAMDLRGGMYEQTGDLKTLYFKTDHHWRPEAGLWAAGEISEKLNEDYGFDIDTDIYDIEKYEKETYEGWLLGSLGKKVSLGYSDPEDLDVYYPSWDTEFHIEIPSIEIYKTGSFPEVMVYRRILQEKHLYEWDSYAVYGHGERPLIKIDNKNINDGKTILVIKDSFADTVYPFLALGVDEISVIDLRYFNGSVRTYIEKEKPDMVIFLAANGSINIGEVNAGNIFYLE